MSGASWTDAGEFVQSASDAAAQFGANAVGLVKAGEVFIDSLSPPDFGLAPVFATAPVPVYTKPGFTERTFQAPALSGLNAGLSAPNAIHFSRERFRHGDLGAFGSYNPEVDAQVPEFTWSPPLPPEMVDVPALDPVPVVTAPTAIQLPDVSGVVPTRPEVAPVWSGVRPSLATERPTFTWTAPTTTLPNVGPARTEPSPRAPSPIQLPDVSGITPVNPENAPTWDGTVEFDTSGTPGAKPSLPVLVAPTVTVPTLPAAPTWNAPNEVQLSEVRLPTLTPLNIPTVTGLDIPSLVLPELQGRLDFADEAFDDSVVQELIVEAREVLGGRLAIPSHIWTRIWERVAADVNRQYLARKREAQRAHAKLGWSMPGGVLLEALQVAASEINAEISAKANEIAIKQAEMQQADYWQAMQQGVALTTLLSQIHNARQERLLKAAIAVIEAQVSVYNAVVTAYNARVQAIVSEIEIKKLQLQAELTKVEVYKTEMEGAKLGVEIDKAKVEMYMAQWNGIKIQAEAYEALVRGIAAQVEAQKAAVEAYGEQIKAQSLVVQMWATEWDAYAKKLEAEKLKLGKYEAEARVFESQVGRFRALIEGQTSRSNIQIEARKLELQRAQIDATRYQADWQGEQLKQAAYESYLKAREQLIAEGTLRLEKYKADIQQESGKAQAWQGQYAAYAQLADGEKLKLGLYEADAKIFGTLVDAHKTNVEALNAFTAAEIEVKKLGLQRAQIDATRYQADWGGEQIKLAGYDAYIKGMSFPLEAAKINADIYQAHVQGALGEVQAWSARYDAYTKLLQKDAIRAQLQNSYASMYGAFVQRESLGVELTKLEQDLAKTYESLVQEYNKTLVAEHQAEAQYQTAQLNANVQAFGTSAELYKADVQGETAKAQVQGEIYKASVEVSKASADMLVEGAKILTAQWQVAAQVAQAQLQASASVYAQLGAAAYAATNASISNSGSYSHGESESVSTNYNYSGQVTG